MKIHANKVLQITKAKGLYPAIIATKDLITHPTAKKMKMHANKVL